MKGPGVDKRLTEAPLRATVGRQAGWELGQKHRGDDESDHVAQIAQDERPATTGAVDEQDGAELSDQRDDAVDALVLERVVARDA